MKEQNDNKKVQPEETEIYLTGNSRLQTPEEDRKDTANDQVKNDRMEPSNDDLHETSSEGLEGSDRDGSDPSVSSLEED
ncbi:MAG: hypothetical protein ACXWB9_04060 [Flavisolibacter sp.]